MKRAKIMLIAIVALASVGGALAFKANKKYNIEFCTLRTQDFANPTTTKCVEAVLISKKAVATDPNPTTYYYTIKQVDDCRQANCTSSTSFTVD